MPRFLAELAPLHSELILIIGAMALLMWGAFRPETERQADVIAWAAIAIMILAGGVLASQPLGVQSMFDGSFRFDAFARFVKMIVLISSAGALLLASNDMRHGKYLKFEYSVLLLMATAGMLMMISANDLIALYLALELQSLALYVLAAFPVVSTFAGQHVDYVSPHFFGVAVMTLYLLSVTASPMLSAHRIVKVFGVLALLSFAGVYYFYANWFISVWCFFAALLSVVIYFHLVLRGAEPDHVSERELLRQVSRLQ